MAEINPLSMDLQQQLMDLQVQGFALLGVAADEASAQIIAAITDHACNTREQGCSPDDKVVFALGALIGTQYVRGLGWRQGDVTWNGDPDSAAADALSPGKSLFNSPIGRIGQIVGSGGRMLFMPSYDMILVNQVPLFERGSAAGLY